jgi:hypothetical protein
VLDSIARLIGPQLFLRISGRNAPSSAHYSAIPFARTSQQQDVRSGRRRTLRVNLALNRVDGKLQLTAPKTDRSRRILPLADNLASALRGHRSRQLEEKLLAGARWKDSGLVFTSSLARYAARTKKRGSQIPFTAGESGAWSLQVPRPAPFLRDAAHSSRRSRSNDYGHFGSQPDKPNDEHLWPGNDGESKRGSGSRRFNTDRRDLAEFGRGCCQDT